MSTRSLKWDVYGTGAGYVDRHRRRRLWVASVEVALGWFLAFLLPGRAPRARALLLAAATFAVSSTTATGRSSSATTATPTLDKLYIQRITSSTMANRRSEVSKLYTEINAIPTAAFVQTFEMPPPLTLRLYEFNVVYKTMKPSSAAAPTLLAYV